ncbi:preprotein translocase, YajC subunit [Syntrophobotulus glycolicus DSM 8271]|uniref:Preprotein translocase, YajC subunit n=1 Tax=Syntrophobotulus glycolicus (strain DSM 8271 / FlGlyR) TaxID=645991 RepID=F0T263_SYNGF|nr:preprotein translocase subunit YajC [Syntrophobotulus glycolicus]ADY56407.1 preprotein translocase, YajC subunit [Syntrophobotulus glycolicus DSM 8271]
MDQNLIGTILWTGGLIGLVYFLMIRPSNKQQKEKRLMLESLRVKDDVILTCGIHGTVTKVKEETIMLKISTAAEIEVEKSALKAVTNREAKAEAVKA